jgi:hypothetical protein
MRVKDFFVDFSKKVDALQTLQKTKFVVLTQLSILFPVAVKGHCVVSTIMSSFEYFLFIFELVLIPKISMEYLPLARC